MAEEHLRHRLLRPAQHGPGAGRVRARPPHHGGVADRRRGQPMRLEGSVFVAGAVVQWLRDGLGIIATAAESEALATSVRGRGRRLPRPRLHRTGRAVLGSRTPAACSSASRAAPRARTSRAPRLEAIAYQNRDVLDAMAAEARAPLARAAGRRRAAANNFLCQFQADVLNVEVLRPVITETTAMGAAFLAGVGAGIWKADALSSRWRLERRLRPRPMPTLAGPAMRDGGGPSSAPAAGRLRDPRISHPELLKEACMLRLMAALAVTAALLAPGSPALAQSPAPIEGELNLITPVSKFIHDAALKAFADYAKEKWNLTVKVSAIPAGTPGGLRPHRGVEGQAGSGHLLGRRVRPLREARRAEAPPEGRDPQAAWDSVPASIGKPKPIPLKDKDGYWIGTALEPYGLVYNPSASSGWASPSRRNGTTSSIPSSRARSPSARPRARPRRTRRTRSSSPSTVKRRAGSGSRVSPPTPATSPRAAATCPPWWPRASSRRASRCPPTWPSRRSWRASTSSSWLPSTPSSPRSPWPFSPARAIRRRPGRSSSSS